MKLEYAGLSVAYSSLTRCEPEIEDRIRGFDYAVLNCGHHPASKLHFSYHKYTNSVRGLLDALHDRRDEVRRYYSKECFYFYVVYISCITLDHQLYTQSVFVVVGYYCTATSTRQVRFYQGRLAHFTQAYDL